MAWTQWRDWPLSQQMLVLAAMVAVAVGALGAGVLGWQGLVSARAQVAREADQSLALVDSTLQLAYQAAVARGRLAIPAVYKAYGGEPRLAEAVATPTGADAAAPTLMAGGEAMNNRLVPLELLRDYTGAETAVLARNGQGRWIALASLRKNEDGSPRLGVPYAADDPVVRAAEAGQPADLLVQRAGRWNVMSIQPLRDPAGRVYGAISARVDVDDDIRCLLQHLGELRPIGGMGQLVVMSPHEKPGAWTYLVHPAFQGRTMDALAPPDRAVVESLLPQPQGFIRVNFANNRTATLMGWRQVAHWGWVVFAVGPEPALMAAAYRTLMLQAALLLGTGLVIAGLIAWRMRRALRPVGSVAQDLVGLGEGDLSRQPPPARLASRNEVQVLFGAFGRTTRGCGARCTPCARASTRSTARPWARWWRPCRASAPARARSPTSWA
ncbi:MAG: hypothetical protein GAK30_03426 [Paracidovorax wautersii]|uniref:Cache 3/Cache 2 fusion domain-containing protein n=1 Tax=Paracidovorax wautersii TaxID=1177982 RepID=A0A7V8FL79_9BURK|nr:MAG: hypothetical protein GAK30_03426 [Paracidovorax wautersii]